MTLLVPGTAMSSKKNTDFLPRPPVLYWLDGVLRKYRKKLELNMFQTWFSHVQVFFEVNTQRNLILPTIVYRNIYFVMLKSDILILSFLKRKLPLKARIQRLCWISKALILPSKPYFTFLPPTRQSRISLAYQPAVSTREIMCPRYTPWTQNCLL